MVCYLEVWDSIESFNDANYIIHRNEWFASDKANACNFISCFLAGSFGILCGRLNNVIADMCTCFIVVLVAIGAGKIALSCQLDGEDEFTGVGGAGWGKGVKGLCYLTLHSNARMELRALRLTELNTVSSSKVSDSASIGEHGDRLG